VAKSRKRGFSLVELLVALLILTVVITTTIYMFTMRRQYLREANETVLVYQVLANEAEVWRRIPFGDLESKSAGFQTDTTMLTPLNPFTTAVKIDKPRDDVKQVTLTVRWQNGGRQARLALVRVDTGGSNLW
jgi:prepilin-type N-terminal cleavage/methylation domain-containing protein